MSTVQEIESALTRLSAEEKQRVHIWLENLLEDQMVFTDEFEDRIDGSEREMAAGLKPRVHQP